MDLFDGVVPLVAIVETGSFRQAASVLGVTSSAISKALTRLEANVGVRLLHRTSRAVVPTAEGEELVRACRDAVAAVRAACAKLDDAQHAPSGRLRVSVPAVLGGRLVAALPKLFAKHRRLSIDVVTTDRFVQLAHEQIDVAIRVGRLDDSSNVAHKLRAVELVTCASPSYLARHGEPRTPAELARHACISFLLSNGRVQPWSFSGRSPHPTPPLETSRLRGDTGEALLVAAKAGIGIIQAPDVMISDVLESGDLVRILRPYTAPGPALYALVATGRQRSPKVRAFIDFARKVIGR